MTRRSITGLVTSFFVLFGCGDSTREDPQLLAAIRVAHVSSPGFHCKGDDKKMTCVCKKGATDILWTCDGFDRWCDFFDRGKRKCDTNGKCTCTVILASSMSTLPSAVPDETDEGATPLDLLAPPNADELRMLRSAPALEVDGHGYTCVGTGTVKSCSCRRGETAEALTCKGMKEMCERGLGKKMDCVTNPPHCRCSGNKFD